MRNTTISSRELFIRVKDHFWSGNITAEEMQGFWKLLETIGTTNMTYLDVPGVTDFAKEMIQHRDDYQDGKFAL